MTKLAVWSIEERDGGEPTNPIRASRSNIRLEKNLEDWIVEDVTIIGDGLTLVGRQVTIDDGRLDLLAIDSLDRWVVIEVKPGLLESSALNQALYYASSLALLDPGSLLAQLKQNPASTALERASSRRIESLLENEDAKREIAVMLVGVGIHPGLARMTEFLERFQVPVDIVSFEVFQPAKGSKLLVREVLEATSEPPKRKYTVEAIRRQAEDAGVVEPFDQFVRMSEQAGLAVQPQRASIRIAPPQNRTRYLMYFHPYTDATSAGLWISVGGTQFLEFFPQIDEREALAVGHEKDGAKFSGQELEQRLDEIKEFLTKHFPRANADED